MKYLEYIPKMVDLGLSSNTLWADRNVGAEKPEDYGNYFRFGEPEPFTEKSREYLFNCDDNPFARSDSDAATVHFNRKCYTPFVEQIRELIDECTWEWVSLNGIKGFEVTGPNGNKIFLPAAGLRSDGLGAVPCDVGSYGYYWSATPYSTTNGRYLGFDSGYWYWGYGYRAFGFSVRPVAEK